MSLHVLVVARWYPAFDNPGRGSFVADHVAALRDAGVDPVVASFEPLPLRGDESSRPARRAKVVATLDGAIQRGVGAGSATAQPRSWGAKGVPVARLPVVDDAARRRPSDTVDSHAAALLAFATELARRRPFDLVHAHTGLPDGIAAVRVADRLGIPLLTTEHSSTITAELADDEARELYRHLVGPGRRLVTVGKTLGREVAGQTGLDPAWIGILPNAVPVGRFPLGVAEERDPDELLYVAARRRTKGIEPLLRSFAIARARLPSLHLRLVGQPGSPDEEEAWSALLDELGIRAAVRFDGPRDRDEVAAAMRRAAIFVHPSPRETFGMVAAEAMASGLPVAASASGGVESIVGTDGRFGEIADCEGHEALAEAILRLLERRQAISPEAVRASIVERFAAPVVAARTLDIYGDLLGRRIERDGPDVSVGRGQGEPHQTTAARVSAEQPSPGKPSPGQSSARPAGAEQPSSGKPSPGQSSARQTSPMPSPGPDRPVLIVGLGRELLVERLGGVPPELAARLVVATRGKADRGSPAPRVAAWLQVDVEAEYARRLAAVRPPERRGNVVRRLARFVRSPLAVLRRRRLVADPDAAKARILAEHLRMAGAIAATRAASAGGRQRPAVVIPIESDDVIAVADAAAYRELGDDLAGGLLRRIGARTRPSLDLAPGGLRWLVDREDAAGGLTRGR